ncbi:MAG: hydroxymethylglutaryl-CoA lyase [Candidatus Kapabacteria bacterium]|nr:hydroxymethylglutaryl-CoA lyase [Candidatus Kapabacteria bacterium]
MKLIECPRDAMQGIEEFIPTEVKAKYINLLLDVGFDTIDFGSFVSSKAIPQLRDTADVLKRLNLENTNSKLLSIVANMQGAENVCRFEQIDYMGYPFSISETFQQRNTNSSIEKSLIKVEEINNLANSFNKDLVVYISMAFGNPYNDPWSIDIIAEWTEKLANVGIKIISFADTIGVSNKENIEYVFKNIVPEFTFIEFGAHLHTSPELWSEKVSAAYENGCLRFDGAIYGYGGCPMAGNEMVGNMPTEKVIDFLTFDKKLNLDLDFEALELALEYSKIVFKDK